MTLPLSVASFASKVSEIMFDIFIIALRTIMHFEG